jgi:hypothetical protein
MNPPYASYLIEFTTLIEKLSAYIFIFDIRRATPIVMLHTARLPTKNFSILLTIVLAKNKIKESVKMIIKIMMKVSS